MEFKQITLIFDKFSPLLSLLSYVTTTTISSFFYFNLKLKFSLKKHTQCLSSKNENKIDEHEQQ